MITPLDIQNKEFSKGFNGYKVDEVQSFLRELMRDYERCYKENIEIKERMDMLKSKLKHYDTLETTLQNTLVVAQKSAEDLSINAREKAENIVKDAENEANRIIEQAQKRAEDKKRELEKLQEEVLVFKLRFKTLLNSELEALDNFYAESKLENNGGKLNE